jgi:hypothetical protein
MQIYIEFTRPKSLLKPFSWAIRAIENTKYSHVRIRWINSVGVDIVYEAAGDRVRFLGPLAQEDNKVDVIKSYCLELSRDEYRGLVKVCMENAGVQYGMLQIFGILLVRVFNLKKNPLSQGRKSQVCSEVVGRMLQEVLDIGHELDLDTAGPRDIQLYLERINNESKN